MDLESFIRRAGDYEILEGWEKLDRILERAEPEYDELVRIIKELQKTNPFLGNLLYIAIRLTECSSDDKIPDNYFSQTLEEFQFLEKFFSDNDLSEGLVVLTRLRKDFPEVLAFLSEKCANA